MARQSILDILSTADDPRAAALSNFLPFPFTLDGVACASMEGFLQSLKTKDRETQLAVCQKSGKAAKKTFEGKRENRRWRLTGFLWWKGNGVFRYGRAYQSLLTRAYDALYENPDFRKVLAETYACRLKHSLGKKHKWQTVLTEKEFIAQLDRLRKRYFTDNPRFRIRLPEGKDE